MHRLFLLFLLFSSVAPAQKKELTTWRFSSEKNPEAMQVQLPHTWNVQDAFDDEPGYWRGKGIYEKTIQVNDTSQVYYLQFGGANQDAKVYMNNQLVGEHKGGYTAFQVPLSSAVKPGENKIKVELSNAHNETIPPLDADFTFYGGLYRKVWLVAENKVHFRKEYGTDKVKISPVLDENYDAEVKLSGEIENPEKEKLKLKISLFNPEGKEVYSEEKNTAENFSLNFPVEQPALWSPAAPNLYKLKIAIFKDASSLVDSYEHNIGFRKFEAAVEGFQLNGKELKLIGVNRHQDWQGMGNAVPVEMQLQDMVKIKEMGANFLRLAHYPQDQAIYKAADSLGLILWSEIPVVNKVPVAEDYKEYEKNVLQMQREHIAQNYNHPSFIFIGYMNEIFIRMVFDNAEGQEKQNIIDHTLKLAQKLENLTLELAPEHITVMAIHGNQIYNQTGITDLPMVLGWNLYYGWYDGKIEDLGGFLDMEHQKFPERPVIISEYGVGADARLHSNTPEKFDFSEEYQLLYHQGYLEQVLARDFVIGMTAWNFADFGSEFRGDAMPHINQKGLVNYDRSPKNIYYWYKSMLRPDEKFSRIYRDLPVHISSSAGKELKIISNQEVVIKLNGEKVAEKIPEDGVVKVNLELTKASNKIEILNREGKIEDEMQLVWQKPDFSAGDWLGINFGSNTYFLDDKDRQWLPASALKTLQISESAKPVKSSTNIRNTKNDPLFQTGITDVQNIKIKVPEGDYNVRLLFANLGKDKKLAYELNRKSAGTGTSTDGFELLLNGNKIKVSPAPEFHFVEKTLQVKAEGNIEIQAAKGTAFYIGGIALQKLD
ncbi:glycoside hydrolase family 2 TIM barrel-domain containing protein [Zunongwangia sp. F363]|uniref:Glycoside hydrolase family 2 TIM barrel-domain containing protein n=1 Tax=Autumnicola tepida TaxID=3075595 RepID=A0ABU3C9Q8_9FLAO|nr:glycoside hydrolase family 2 TIM barrel-domain containing protein [Zunongwangia sp. F363]MDT0643069.1 glycoside hydrolase family 2 TIM barrel-domain containing protein [Zunongwangia sp. F363]